MQKKTVSIIVPVFNRAAEAMQLLKSLLSGVSGYTHELELIIADDGSEEALSEIIKPEVFPFDLRIVRQENSGPGKARNIGAGLASGEWLLFVDSDCEFHEKYAETLFETIKNAKENGYVLLGGPDTASETFTITQKAIQYAMSSVLTTGGIRGSKKALDTYFPRSFNMLIRKDVFNKAGGYSDLRFGEDLDLSMRLKEMGHKGIFVPELFIIHKRRIQLRAFFKQVFNSGMARVVLNLRHPGTLKTVHLLPSIFTVFLVLSPIFIMLLPGLFYLILSGAFLLMLHAMIKTRSVRVSVMALPASVVQLTGYGSGLIRAYIDFNIRKKEISYAFRNSFYD